MSSSPVYAVRKQPSLIDYPGHLSAVLFLSGCNFSCGFCHNTDLMIRKPHGVSWKRLRSLCDQFRRDWIDAVTITGGEPTLSSDLPELVRFFSSQGFRVKLDTNGSRPDMLGRVLDAVNSVAMDFKCSLSRYPQLTGFTDTDRIKDSIHQLMNAECDVTFRTTVLQPFHIDAEMESMLQTLHGARHYVLQPFCPHPDLPDPMMRTWTRTPRQRLNDLAVLARQRIPSVDIAGQ